ncbi:MAG: carbohydrate ABC transporter permease [Anaerolineae bacterium]|nr:carbohydrate ABC transporter permease [Anaerolineae bacterium]
MVLLIPNFVFVRNLSWVGTYQGIVAPVFLMTPFAVFYLRQFFLSLSNEITEAAILDGASQFGIFWRIAVPLSKSALITLAILTFLGSWNDYLWPLIVGRNENVRVLTVALGIFRSQTPQGAPDWGGLMAATSLAIIPSLVIFVVLGRKIIDLDPVQRIQIALGGWGSTFRCVHDTQRRTFVNELMARWGSLSRVF